MKQLLQAFLKELDLKKIIFTRPVHQRLEGTITYKAEPQMLYIPHGRLALQTTRAVIGAEC